MSLLRFVWRSLVFYRWSHAAVAATVAVATAVLCGAMFVGDSLKGSLRDLALDRLQKIDDVLISEHFFRHALADETRNNSSFGDRYERVVPAILLESSLETVSESGQHPFRLGQVQTIGCEADFWELENKTPSTPHEAPSEGEIWLSQFTAEQLRAKVGDEIILRIGATSDIPADSPLGRKTETSRSRRLKITRVLPNQGLANFSLKATQQQLPSAFVATAVLQSMLDQTDKVNALFFQRNTRAHGDGQPPSNLIRAKSADLGLIVSESPLGFVQISSDRMLLDPNWETGSWPGRHHVLTYLANWLEVVSPESGRPCRIPYSTVSAIDFEDASWLPKGITTVDGQVLSDIPIGGVLLSAAAAEDFQAQGHPVKLGDPIKITYFEPESTHGEVREKEATFKLAGVVPVEGWAADPLLTPELKGVTDQKSIANWDPPFPYDPKRVRTVPPNDQDDAYWKKHKALPRAFISWRDGAIWASRFGWATAYREELPKDINFDAYRAYMENSISLSWLNQHLIPIRDNILSAASGSTPFGVLFLAFSFFLMVAALLLVAVVFRLTIDQRAKEVGVLQAVGVNPRDILFQQALQGMSVAAVGAALGVLLGVGYAALMIAGLNSPWFWRAAIGRSFLTLHVHPISCLLGWLAGIVTSLIAMALAIRRLKRWPLTRLLAGQVEGAQSFGQASRWPFIIAALCLVGAIALAAFSPSGGEAEAGSFFGSGGLLLAALLLAHHGMLHRNARNGRSLGAALTNFPLIALAARSARRNPMRSTLTIGLVAAATFLIVAVSSFQLDATQNATDKASGAGGYALIAETSQPIYVDINTPQGRSDLGFSPAAEKVAKECQFYSIRVSGGDNASCLNLFQVQQPRTIFVDNDFIQRGGFTFSAIYHCGDSVTDEEVRQNPWQVLRNSISIRNKDSYNFSASPLVLDGNTAQYALHWGDGVQPPLGYVYNEYFVVAGLLKDSILQGNLICPFNQTGKFNNLKRPSGYQMFLIDAPDHSPKALQEIKTTLEEALSDYGFHAIPAAERLAEIMKVQNTYLSTFQTLGGLGLLLGTLGLAVVELRSIWERRSELALLQATGWKLSRLARLVLCEHAYLLLAGLAMGLVAALVAVFPHLRMGLAGLPVTRLAITLLAVLICGLMAGWIAVRFTAKVPLIPTLREAK